MMSDLSLLAICSTVTAFLVFVLLDCWRSRAVGTFGRTMYRDKQPIRFWVFFLVPAAVTICAMALSLNLLWIILRNLLG
jgi:hypothetical protein